MERKGPRVIFVVPLILEGIFFPKVVKMISLERYLYIQKLSMTKSSPEKSDLFVP